MRVSHSEPAVVAVHAGDEPDLKLADACLAIEESTTDVGGGGGVRVTLNRPRTTLKKTYELSTVVSNSNECFDKTGFAAATRAAVLDGVSCALITTGIHGSGKSRLVRGHGADGRRCRWGCRPSRGVRLRRVGRLRRRRRSESFAPGDA